MNHPTHVPALVCQVRRAVDNRSRIIRVALSCAVVLLATGRPLLAADSSGAEAAIEFFEKEVRPVLAENCFKCHGPKKQWASLRLDSREAMLQGGDSGPALVAGDPKQSRLIAAIRHQDDLQMPPESKLTARQIAAISRWVELGAAWPKSEAKDALSKEELARRHWAFQPIRKPQPPTVKQTSWIKTPIDSFILARLEAAGLSPAPVADRRTLIRRATYDLTGLPPSVEEVEAFERDNDPKAYERLIDRLLASPHYGEQWGRHWLDVARYSDTKGYVYAREERFWVHAWAYRDWVVRALNEDMPYDRFLLLQIAGDQAAGENKADLAATGFLTLGRRFIGVTHDIIDDRIDVVTRGTMGLTVGCARCHDHKFDPIPTRDYYSLYGVFQSSAERLVPLAKPATADAAFEKGLQEREKKYLETMATRRAEVATRNRARVADYLTAQFELHKYPNEAFDQVLAKEDILPAFVRRWQTYLYVAAKNNDPVFLPWTEFAKLPEAEFSQRTAKVTSELAGRPAGAVHPLVAKQFATPPGSMKEVIERYGKVLAEVESQWQAELKRAEMEQRSPPTSLADPAAEAVRQEVLYGPNAPCVVPDEAIVNNELYFDSGTCTELWQLRSEVDRWLINSPNSPAYATTLVDRQPQTDPRVFVRGNPANKGDEVPRQFLKVIAGPERKPFQNGSGRLEMAKAIIDPSNPLTARVMVNRIWMGHFGAGLVRTPSDFGTRAEAPTHPELLDWLASQFIADGWSLKKLHRQILLSATYQQSSAAPAESSQVTLAQRLDPENRLLWRMNARRLTFEELRDTVLSASGKLDVAVGGKPVNIFAEPFPRRRTIYGLVDRQFLPGTLRVFDFANPDLHIPQRSETTVPQQALFFLNDGFVLDQSIALAKRVETSNIPPAERIRQLFRSVYQRDPTPAQVGAALSLVRASENEVLAAKPAKPSEWQYGFGEYDEATQRLKGFTRLPHFTGDAWQGGPSWPDAKLGWAQLTAEGGHAGNDRQHAVARRWVAPRDTRIAVTSTLIHNKEPGDGIRGFLVSSRTGLLRSAVLHNKREQLDVESLDVKAGDTLDFVVDIGGTLNHDDFVWETSLTEVGVGSEKGAAWNARTDFGGTPSRRLGPWEQLAQVLLASNEMMFVD